MSVAVLPRPDVFRQSLLAGAKKCMRRTLASLLMPDDLAFGWVEASGDLGTVWHLFAAEYFRTLQRPELSGERQLSTQEAVEIMREVYAASPIFLPHEEFTALVGMVVGFCEREWDVSRIAAIEQRITLDLVCPDGEVRTFKGQPDLVLYDPPHGLAIWDWKSGKGKPKKPQTVAEGDDQEIEGKKYLSDAGHYQGHSYGLGVLAGRLDDGSMIAPRARYVNFYELHLRSRKVRWARLDRAELEHIESEIALDMLKVDRAIREGQGSRLWKPRPGSHCLRQCPVSRSCTVPEEMRGIGAVGSQETADKLATAYPVVKAQYKQFGDQLKAWEEAGNPPGRVNDGEVVRWDPPGSWAVRGNGRKHGLHPVVDAVNDSEGSR